MAPNVFTLPLGVPFLEALARAILKGDLPRPGGNAPDILSLPKITLLLPTRRAARAAREAFLSVAGTRALIMPRIQPISEGDDDVSLISNLLELGRSGIDALEQTPAINPLNRMLVLMQLVGHWRQTMAEASTDKTALGSTPAQAAQLATELAKLMDDIERENVSLAGIQSLVPENYAEHWKKTVEFLKIVTEFWPAYLAANALASPEARRNALILAETERIARLKPDEVVIVAGVTGSIPATVSLMRAVATHASGAVVLPALDTSLDETSWNRITPEHPEHPQFGLKKLLDNLSVSRADVHELPGLEIDAARRTRSAFFSEAMRPSATTNLWHDFATHANRADLAKGLAGVSLVEAPSAQDEAETIALILREAIETPGRKAALVSPDRLLARRVAIRLEAWGIRVDDSAGRPFAKTVPGAFLALVINAVVSRFAPAETMALLHHPLCRIGFKAFDIRRFARALEISAFRRPYLGRGVEGIIAALDHADLDEDQRKHRAAERLWPEDTEGARALVLKMADAFGSLSELYASDDQHTLADLARAHAAAAEALAAWPEDERGVSEQNQLWQGEAGEMASRFFADLLNPDTPKVEIRAADYADLYATLLSRANVRERTAVHPRISIWGPFEARLQQPDVLIVGSLNEGTWPEAAEPGAWLNRPMRTELGLPSPEEEIGRAAHDFISLLGAETVYLTRAEKVDGVPTVPSRWLMRVTALLKGMNLLPVLEAKKPWLGWARARDHIDPQNRRTIQAPEPRPPFEMRPRRMSVTEVERWTSNPYAIFARRILAVEPLPELGAEPDASLRGGIIHKVVADFTRTFPAALPADPQSELKRIATSVLESFTGHPRIAAFWLPRLERFLEWFAMTEAARRTGVDSVIAETSGRLVLTGLAEPFTLSARADRIDDLGTAIVITDYKTGAAPNDTAVKSGRSPQLPLEAAIAASETGFPNLSRRSVQALRYIRASGSEPPGEERIVKTDDVAALAAEARTGLEQLITTFDNPQTPYRAIRRPGYRYDYDAYAHLARVAEWSAHVEDEASS
ncbi:double-strand break repair protein AddB [Hyphomicrobium sp. MC1]|uniref:double-strand break repair protein AddB n=1 Tax=Hyphomicrobium sp. (strain MC1) TaxID=717785 RepID=UPI000213DA5B|nr:double-strand break repair protein AddB [Hyphomicrobium sp. MC1]CCB63789.1 Double-strand break repair protein AddB [Hyphomicrobium sp. MC1]